MTYYLFTVSYVAIVYSRWLSSQPLAIPISTLFFLLYYLYLTKKDWYLLAIALVFGLLTQIQFLNLIFFTAIFGVLLIIHHKRFIQTNIVILCAAAVLLAATTFGNFLLFDIRHKYLIFNSILHLLSGKTGYYGSYTQVSINVFSELATFVAKNLTPFSVHWSVLIIYFFLLAILIKQKKTNFSQHSFVIISVWLVVPIISLVVLRHAVLPHFLIPLTVPVLLGMAVIIHWLKEKNTILGISVFSLLIAGSTYMYFQNIPQNKDILFQQNQLSLRLVDQRKSIDSIYQKAAGKPFSVQTYTIPYFWQDGWTYLFWFYGEKKYGYYPVPEKADTLFVIVQDDPSGKQFQDDWLKHTVSKWGTKKESWRYGILETQRLEVNNNF
jgi:hypothetical protein